MTHPNSRRQNYAWCIWVGFQLMCFALFLHPMSPEGFLSLAVTAPFETLSEPYGSGMAQLFWLSACFVMIGLFGWSGVGRVLKAGWRMRFRGYSKFRHSG
jgi:hypothetical protein